MLWYDWPPSLLHKWPSFLLSSFPHIHPFISFLVFFSEKEKLRQRSVHNKVALPFGSAPCTGGPTCWMWEGTRWACSTAVSAKLSVVPLLHLYTYKHLYNLSLQHIPVWLCRDCIYFSPHIHHTLWSACSGPRVAGAALQQHGPFPLTTLAAVPTSGPGTVFPETLNHFWLFSAPSLSWHSQ